MKDLIYQLLYGTLWVGTDTVICSKPKVKIKAKVLTPLIPITATPIGKNEALWQNLISELKDCTKCTLCNHRKNVVIERGSHQAKLMVITDGPNWEDDLTGKVFSGINAQLINKMMNAINLDPEIDVYYSSLIKCKPQSYRKAELTEINSCQPFLLKQIELLAPQVILILAQAPLNYLLKTEQALAKLRGVIHYYQNIPVVVSYPISYLINNPEAKQGAWQDLKLVAQLLLNHPCS